MSLTIKSTDKFGNIEYRLNGQLHNDTGPARVYRNGSLEYYVHGVRHRTNGPAVIAHYGTDEYWVNGVRIRSVKRDIS